jgi:hypothetical protein
MAYIFGFTRNLIPVKTFELATEQCPNCQQHGQLAMHCYQVEEDGVVTQRLLKMETKVVCRHCQHELSQQQWTENMRQQLAAARSSISLVGSTKISKYGKRVIAVAVGCCLFVGVIFLANKLGWLKSNSKNDIEQGIEQTRVYTQQPLVGDICKILIQEPGSYYTLAKVVKVDQAGNSISLAFHREQIRDFGQLGTLSASDDQFDKANAIAFVLKDFAYQQLHKVEAKAGDQQYGLLGISRNQ